MRRSHGVELDQITVLRFRTSLLLAELSPSKLTRFWEPFFTRLLLFRADFFMMYLISARLSCYCFRGPDRPFSLGRTEHSLRR
ncbi:hypothetical protein C5C20_01145 [Rathayibacter rathayi]|nr:hypothetical protein C5C08_01140 [Rathayibacter rathayi]PPF83596.1 hypothetical protein C5C14_01140 [Rathayibacter rathayi]PPG16137.1 hypothetical protein C5C11_00305 [Rathayibacter rathayi]PPG47415.1 hypothetical protein C5C20_01145 [Rathayibacter rathayi]PPI04980.1 hypothetical protein C5C43_01145 [Rathayibacter rathayi]